MWLLRVGGEFPDKLNCGEYPLLIVSARVADDWERHKINDFYRFPVRVKEVVDTEAKLFDTPDYCRIEVKGSCKVDLEGSGLVIRRKCRACRGGIYFELTTRRTIASTRRVSKARGCFATPYYRESSFVPPQLRS